MSERTTVMKLSKKSAEAILDARRRAEREGELVDPIPIGETYKRPSMESVTQNVFANLFDLRP